MTDTIDAMTGELVPVHVGAALFRTDDPADVLAEAKRVAAVLKPALIEGKMTTNIGRSEHVNIEGWQTLGGMLKVFAHTVWTRQLPEPLDGWEACAEIHTLDGRVLGRAESMCDRSESTWARKPGFQIKSQAQTRAQSKAFAGSLRFIVTLAGYSGTPAEEVVDEKVFGPPGSSKESKGLVRAIRALYGDEDANLDELAQAIETDAGGYLPKVVARAVMLVAAHRPDPEAEAGTVSQDHSTEDATETGESNPVVEDVNGDAKEGAPDPGAP